VSLDVGCTGAGKCSSPTVLGAPEIETYASCEEAYAAYTAKGADFKYADVFMINNEKRRCSVQLNEVYTEFAATGNFGETVEQYISRQPGKPTGVLDYNKLEQLFIDFGFPMDFWAQVGYRLYGYMRVPPADATKIVITTRSRRENYPNEIKDRFLFEKDGDGNWVFKPQPGQPQFENPVQKILSLYWPQFFFGHGVAYSAPKSPSAAFRVAQMSYDILKQI